MSPTPVLFVTEEQMRRFFLTGHTHVPITHWHLLFLDAIGWLEEHSLQRDGCNLRIETPLYHLGYGGPKL